MNLHSLNSGNQTEKDCAVSVKVTVKMASSGRCADCFRLADFYYNRVGQRARLVEKHRATVQDGGEAVGDLEWRIVQAKSQVDEARKVFLDHRSTHFSK